MLYLNENEKEIIENFMAIESKYIGKIITLKWSEENQVVAQYDSFIEDENDFEIDDERYEEFWSFVFKKIEIFGIPPIKVSEDGFFLVNYHNFPEKILFDDKQINLT